MTAGRAARSIRLVTFNIHKGIGGVDRKYRPERIVKVLKQCDADLVLLQEVADGTGRSRYHRQVDLLADALGYEHACYYPNATVRQGRYGNALLSRFPIDHHENIDLSMPLKKKRGALHARLNVDLDGIKHRVWIYNVHLGLAEIERRWQLRRLLRWHLSKRPSQETAVMMGGDFNDVWNRLGPLTLEPAAFRGIKKRPMTFPAARPFRPLDAVFVSGPAHIARSWTFNRLYSKNASDHLPLVTSLRIG